MSELPVPHRSRTRRFAAPALAMVAVAGVAAGAVVLAQHRGPGGAPTGGRPPTLHLADGAMTAESAALAPLGYGRPTVVGTLPTGPNRAAVRTLPAGAAPAATVTALATVLGLSGTPARAEHGWLLVHGNRSLRVSDTAGQPWALGSAVGPPGSVTCHLVATDRGRLCPPGVVLPPQPDPKGGGGSAGPGGSSAGGTSAGGPSAGGPSVGGGSAKAGSAGSGSAGAGSAGVPAPGAPANDGNGSGATVTLPDRPTGAPAAPVPVEPVPLPRRPTDADALLAARPVLSVLGLAGAQPRVLRMPGQVSVMTEPVVDGLATSGFETTLVVAPGGTVTAGSGWLGRSVRGAEYPLVPAAEAIEQMAVPEIARMCGKTACPVQTLQVTGAALGLALRWEVSGRPLLVPAWRFTVRGQDFPMIVIAVQPAYLGDGAEQGVPAEGHGTDVPGRYPNGGVPTTVLPAPTTTR